MALKLVSRSAWGARPYRTPNGATPYGRARRGVKLHYLGTAYSDRPHAQCAAYIRQLQAQHMDGNGWSDIGYSFLVCTHGYVYEGRGLRRRNSANGNTALNEQDYAVCLLVGSSGLTKPTDAQLDGARDAIDYCRREGPAGTWLGGHRDGYATACPGDAVYAWVKKGAPRPATSTPPTAPAQEDSMAITDADARKVAKMVLTMDGVIANPNPATAKTNTHIALMTAVRNIETVTRRSEQQIAAQSAAITKLASLVGSGVDTDTVVTAVRDAIRDAVIKVDVDITQNQES
ncbi:N-acetylmuramoyl-L-alanine amidase [Streptomyces sp. bgisy022]|uniref:N-acetylmuramoyl-L-alanine amidase n=1 Tax=Streptomyces sp. bgisy022 TaxID=3413769 RepID=UPI003D75DF2E